MVFEETKLDNGMTIYGRRTDDPFVYIKIYVPIGSMNNTFGVIPGTAHFLEHMVCNRSAMFPELDSYDEYIMLNGGSVNAGTSLTHTGYYVNVPVEMFEQAFRGLVSRVFEPLFDERDISNEVAVISNERRRKNMWFPASNKLSHHYMTQWKYLKTMTLSQIFGDDEDLQSMDCENLSIFHKNYFDPRVFVVVAGSYDLSFMCRELSRFFETTRNQLPEKIEQIRWHNKEYHEKAFVDENTFTYNIGCILDKRDYLDMGGISFLGNFLVNSVHGPLYKWLRSELGWSYGLGFNFSKGALGYHKPHLNLSFPVSTYKQSQHVREEVHERIMNAIKDDSLIQRELNRRFQSSIFLFQRIENSIDEAVDNLMTFGFIETVAQYHDTLIECADPDFLRKIYDQYFSPLVVGEFLSTPE